MRFELIATAAFGLEALVAAELRRLGYRDLAVDNGQVTFRADEAAVCRANLWLRTADRVLIKMGSFPARTFDELFDGTRGLPWADWLPVNAAFPVRGKSVDSQLFSVPDCQAIVKKAIVVKKSYKQRWFPETGPLYAVEVALRKDVATLTIDTTGPGLHKRGYRRLVGPAPLKETLAAALVLLSRWQPDRALLDPLCGTGTIPIEAALLGKNIAPGLNRGFAAEAWPNLPPHLWAEARTEARDLVRRGLKLRVYGSDIDPASLNLARLHAREAGLEGEVFFQRLPVSRVSSRFEYGYLITNPPYGKRLGKEREVEGLYRELGEIFRRLETWSAGILTTHPNFERLFGRRADRKRKLYNGRIECHYYLFWGPQPKLST